MNVRLKGKVAIVTEGAQGIGREYCLRLSLEGAAVTIADMRFDQAKALEAEIAEKAARPWPSRPTARARPASSRW